MALHRSLGPVLLASALSLGGLLPAETAAADGADEPVSVIPLTTSDAALTGLADDGLEALAAPQTLRSTAASGSAADTAADVADTERVAVLTAPIATAEFYVAGVTWDGVDAMPQDAALFIRVLEDGQWQDWDQLEVEAGADEPGAVGGTEPYTAAGAEAVQVQITGDAARLPANIRLSLTPEWPSAQEVLLTEDAPVAVAPAEEPLAPVPAAALPYEQPAGQTVSAPQAATTEGTSATADARATAVTSAVAAPNVTSRAGWGANESMMRWTPRHVALRATVVHHTAGTNNYTQSQSASIVRGIYHYHAVTRNWGDIGYNFLVDKWGRVFEGRRGTLTSASGTMPVGAHAAPFNTHTMGLSVMGDYTRVGVPQAAMNALADIIAWQFGRAGLTATHRSGLISNGTYARPKGQNLGRVFAHRDVSNTACPGDDIYSRMGWLARAADQRMAASPTAPKPTPAPAPPPRPVDPIDHTAKVFLNNDWGPWSSIDFNLGNRSTTVYSGDWNGDGKDTLALRVGSTFYVYNSNVTGAEVWIAPYGRADDEVLVGDWDGDGRDSFAVRRGQTFYVKNSITSGDADEVITYGRAGDEVHVGDWNSDGKDTFAVRRGAVFHVKNRIAGGPADEVITYGRPGDRVLVGDWDGDGVDTFAVRRGFEYHVKNRIAGGPADIVVNYGRKDDVVIVGDWDGDGTDTLGVHRR